MSNNKSVQDIINDIENQIFDTNEASDNEDIDFIMEDIDNDDDFEYENSKLPYKCKWDHITFDHEYHYEKLNHNGHFKREYRMSFSTYEKLHEILKPYLQRQTSKTRSNRSINTHIMMVFGVRWLAGGNISDLSHIVDVSRSAAYHITYDFLDAVLAAPELNIELPKTPNQWNEIRLGFQLKSTDGIIDGCVGCLDGLLQKTIAPSASDVTNIRSYYSGHYEHYGLNCQAEFESSLKCIYFGVVAPGSTNDNIAYHFANDLADTIKQLPQGLYFIGDAAYSSSDKLLIPFTDSQRDNQSNDAYNFYISQLRIRIEMAFGLLVSKFRILKTPLQSSVKKMVKLLWHVLGCTIL